MAEALAEEAVSLDTEEEMAWLSLLSSRIRSFWGAFHEGVPTREISCAIRKLRKELVPISSRVKVGCIIAVGKFGGSLCLLKNRDRNYLPEIKVYHEIRNGVEVLYALDEVTGWAEGFNEYGIGIVNAALMVGRDEAEKKLVKTVGKKSKDGERILKVLEQKNLEDAIEQACHFKGGIKGHTFVSDATKTVSLEHTSKHDCIVKTVASGKIHVRTNHGFHHTDAGYTDGEDYVSSVARRDQAKKVLRDVSRPEEVAPSVYEKRKEDLEDPNNMVRDTDNMKTTSQLVLDLTGLRAFFYIIPDKVKYLGYQRDIPKDREAKLQLRVFKYSPIGEDGEYEVVRVRKDGGD